jgi:N-acyl-D-aspartate/D-glutamate deacylase
VADELRTVITSAAKGQSAADWQRRAEVWRDPRALVGASDAGAHLDMIDSFAYCTTVLAKAVREHAVLSVEEAVHLMTQRPAGLYGLHSRGLLAAGKQADVIVFDPDEVAPLPVRTEYDMPAGAGRLYGGATGMHYVVVAGEEIVEDGVLTERRPGRVLRSGTDTHTVSAASLAAARRGVGA